MISDAIREILNTEYLIHVVCNTSDAHYITLHANMQSIDMIIYDGHIVRGR